MIIDYWTSYSLIKLNSKRNIDNNVQECRRIYDDLHKFRRKKAEILSYIEVIENLLNDSNQRRNW